MRLDRTRKGKKLSNADRVSRTDPDAKIAKMKDGTTHLAYKPEHAVDLDTGAVVAAEIHPADEGATTLSGTLQVAAANLAKVDRVPTTTATAELVADKGYHSRAVLKDLDGGVWKTRIAEPQHTALLRWRGDTEARNAVYANRNRLRSAVGKQSMRQRRRSSNDRSPTTWSAAACGERLRGRENVHKRYLIHVAGHNLGILMRLLIGAGTPKEAARGRAFLFVNYRDDTLAIVIFALDQAGLGILVVIVATEPI